MIDSYKGKACLKKEEVVTVAFSSVCLIFFLTFFSKFSCCKARFFLEYPDFLAADLRKALNAFCGNASTPKIKNKILWKKNEDPSNRLRIWGFVRFLDKFHAKKNKKYFFLGRDLKHVHVLPIFFTIQENIDFFPKKRTHSNIKFICFCT